MKGYDGRRARRLGWERTNNSESDLVYPLRERARSDVRFDRMGRVLTDEGFENVNTTAPGIDQRYQAKVRRLRLDVAALKLEDDVPDWAVPEIVRQLASKRRRSSAHSAAVVKPIPQKVMVALVKRMRAYAKTHGHPMPEPMIRAIVAAA